MPDLISLALPYFHLNFKELFHWSSGYEMPIYFDGKSFLSIAEHRSAIMEKCKDFFPEKFQTIAATAMGGLVPAASLAGELNKPLAFLHRRNLYCFTPGVVEKVISGYLHYSVKNCDMVVSTAPFGILPGVHLADKLGLPFAYVRKESKMHGMQHKIEGMASLEETSFPKKRKVIFIDWYEGKSYGAQAIRALEEQGTEVMEYKDMEIPAQGKGKLGKTVHVEDVVSFGTSSLPDIHEERVLGATIEQCLSVFTYNFLKTQERFSREDCSLQAFIKFDDLLASASWTAVEKEQLKAWHEKPK